MCTRTSGALRRVIGETWKVTLAGGRGGVAIDPADALHIYAQAAGASWQDVRAGQIPNVVFVRQNAVIPHIAVAQHTAAMNWNDVELRVFGPPASAGQVVTALFAKPDGPLQQIELRPSGGAWGVARDPSGGTVRWRVTEIKGVRLH